MRRGICLIVGLIVLFSIVNVLAIDLDSIDSQVQKIDDKVSNVNNIIEDPLKARDEIRSAYLKREFGKVLINKPYIGGIIKFYQKISPYTDPVFEYAVGMKPSWSWFFALVFIIWLVLIKYFYTFYEILRDFSTFSDWVSLAISLCILMIMFVLNFFQSTSLFLANKIVALLELLNIWWVKVLGVIVFIVVSILAGKFSNQLNVIAQKIKDNREKMKKELTELDRTMRAERATKRIEKIAEEFSDD